MPTENGTIAPFPTDPEMTAIAIAYHNKKLIADEVLPRTSPLGKKEFKYWKYEKKDAFTISESKIGRKSKVNEVETNATRETSSTEDYALAESIPYQDIDNAPEGYDPRGRATEYLTSQIALGREKRVADSVFNAATYDADNKTTLSGDGQWSHVDSDPVKTILTAKEGMIMPGNILVLGSSVAFHIRQNKAVVKAFNGTLGDKGLVPLEWLREQLELDAIYVGQSRYNAANKGQAMDLQSLWGKHAALIYRDQLADVDRGTTFGLTAQYGERRAGTKPVEPGDMGLDGGERVMVGESVKELITAPDLGYFFKDAVT